MKKNVMMRLASVLLVCVLLSTSVISGTFAKYVTSGEATATARVAKWGVAINSTADTMFAKTYTADSATSFANTVEATEKVVAPGTKNDDAVTFGITGTPEVAVKVTLSIADGFKDVKLPAGTYKDRTTAVTTDEFTTGDYTPVVYTLKLPQTDGTTVTYTGNLADIKTSLASYSVEFAPGTNLSTAFNDTDFGLSWAWAFNDVTANNQADTVLGDVAAGTYAIADACTEIDFTLSILIEQID